MLPPAAVLPDAEILPVHRPDLLHHELAERQRHLAEVPDHEAFRDELVGVDGEDVRRRLLHREVQERLPPAPLVRGEESVLGVDVLHDHPVVGVVVEPLAGAVGGAVVEDDYEVAELAEASDARLEVAAEFVLHDQRGDELHGAGHARNEPLRPPNFPPNIF